jgi:hypothetical protein
MKERRRYVKTTLKDGLNGLEPKLHVPNIQIQVKGQRIAKEKETDK